MYSLKHIPVSITNNAPLSILVLSPDAFNPRLTSPYQQVLGYHLYPVCPHYLVVLREL